MKKKVLIFIITYYSSYKLKEVFNLIPFKKLKNYKINVLISDDKSKDDTMEYAIKICNNNKANVAIKQNFKRLNYGGNIKSCLDYAQKKNYQYAVMLHGDAQYSPKYIPTLIKKIIDLKCVAVYGSRMKIKKNALKGRMPIYKFIGNIFLTFIFNKIYFTNFSDCHSGYWVYDLRYINKNIYKNLTNTLNFDNQLRIKLVKNHLKINEIPIKTIYKDENKSFQLIYAFKFLFETIFKRFN
jgi:GT2 family glycosyltransferase